MTDTERDLLRAVCEVPDDDTPRLVYADWLDENGQGERAEFIRCQIDHANIPTHECDRIYPGCTVDMTGPYVYHNHKCRGYDPQQRYIKLWDRNGKDWFGEMPFSFDVFKGWPMRVAITLSQLMGGPCGSSVNESHGLSGDCPHCHGTGTIPGLARELFEKWPITGVRLSDREPQPNSYGGPVVAWHTDPNESWMPSWIPYHLLRIMATIVDEGGDLDGRTWITFPAPDAAIAALSAAAVAYGRELVGLPPITSPATPPNSIS